MPTGQLQFCQETKQKAVLIVNNLFTPNVWSLWENLKPWPCRLDLTVALSMQQGLSLRFTPKDLSHC